MSVPTAPVRPMLTAAPSPSVGRRIALVRAGIAVLWAVVLVVALGDDVSRATSELPTQAALLLVGYPLIDVVASVVEAVRRTSARPAVHVVNAVVGLLAAVGLAVASLGSDAGAVLVVFGAWATLSGAIQLGLALHRRRAGSRQMFMVVSGGLSTVIGVAFAVMARQDEVDLGSLAGYAVGGAVLYVLWATLGRAGAARRQVS